VDEQKPPVGSERCIVGTGNTPDPATSIACERRASSLAAIVYVLRTGIGVECAATSTGSQFYGT